MSVKQKRLPAAILEAAFRRLEAGGSDLLRLHPNYEKHQQKEDQAFAAVEDKLAFQERDRIESVLAWAESISFCTGYAVGFMDGAGSREALDSAEKDRGRALKAEQMLEELEAEAVGVDYRDESPLTSFYIGAYTVLRSMVKQGVLTERQCDHLDAGMSNSMFSIMRKGKEGARPLTSNAPSTEAEASI